MAPWAFRNAAVLLRRIVRRAGDGRGDREGSTVSGGTIAVGLRGGAGGLLKFSLLVFNSVGGIGEHGFDSAGIEAGVAFGASRGWRGLGAEAA